MGWGGGAGLFRFISMLYVCSVHLFATSISTTVCLMISIYCHMRPHGYSKQMYTLSKKNKRMNMNGETG